MTLGELARLLKCLQDEEANLAVMESQVRNGEMFAEWPERKREFVTVLRNLQISTIPGGVLPPT